MIDDCRLAFMKNFIKNAGRRTGWLMTTKNEGDWRK